MISNDQSYNSVPLKKMACHASLSRLKFHHFRLPWCVAPTLRKPLKSISSPPPLCLSPSASFVGSPHLAPGQGDQFGAPFDLSRADSQSERYQTAHPPVSSGLSSERATAVVAEEETDIVKPAADKQEESVAGTGEPTLTAGKVAAVVCLFENLAENMKGRRDEKHEGLSHDKFQALSTNDERTTISEQPRYPASPFVPGSERYAVSEGSPRLVPLDSGLDAPVAYDHSSPSLQTMLDVKGLQGDGSLHDNDDTERLRRCDGHAIVAATPSEQEGKGELPSAGDAQGVESVLADVLSPSPRWDVTHIETETASLEERQPSAPSQDCLDLLEGTVLDVRQVGSRGDVSGVGMTAVDMTAADRSVADMIAADGEGTLLCFADQNLNPLHPSGNCSSNTTDELAPFDLTNDQTSLEHEQGVSAGSNQSPRSEICSDIDGGVESKSTASRLRDSRVSGSLSRGHSMGSMASADSGTFDPGASGSPRDGLLECRNRPPSQDSGDEHGAESPDVVLRGSVALGSDNSSKGPGSDRGTWGKDALGRRCLSDGRDNDLGFAVQQSQDSPFGNRTFGSTLSPAIGGFGIDAADALSPLLAQPLFVDDLDGVENEDYSDGVLSSAVSARSDSTVEEDLKLPLRQNQSMALRNEDPEEINPRTPNSSRLSGSEGHSATTPMGWRTGEHGSKKSVSPASSVREPLAPRRKEQRHKLSARHPMTPERHSEVPPSRGKFGAERTPPGRCGYTSPATSGGITGEKLRDESFLDTAQSLDGDGGDHGEQVSIGSFSESDIGGDNFRDEDGRREGTYEGDADVSLVEGTPRQRVVGSGETMSGFYAPLPVRRFCHGCFIL